MGLKDMQLYIVITMIFLAMPCYSSDRCGQHRRQWTIPGHMPTDLCCNVECPQAGPVHDKLDEKRCCSCVSTPYWYGNDLPYLSLEYTTIRGSSVLFSSLPTEAINYQVQHMNGFLTKFPYNMCDFDGIVKLQLDDNKIEAIQNLACLMRLDTLSLVRNRITIVTNETFTGMSYLRVLDLSGNRIKVLDAGTFSDNSLAVQRINFANNDLEVLDVTNIIIEKPFCVLNFSQNKIEDVTNDIGFKFEADKTYGSGGMVLLQDNLLSSFIDFKKIGLNDLTLLGKVMTYGFDLRGTNIKCDCTIEPFLELAYDVIQLIWRNYFDVKCYDPPSLRNQSIVKLINASRFDLFICNIENDCPPHCRCTAKPYLNITVINCSSAGLRKLPLLMPDAENLVIDLSGNTIQRLEHRDYLYRTTELNVSYNSINDIGTQALDAMRYISLLNVTGNRELDSIPEAMTQIQPCAIDFTEVYLECDCNNIWIGEWFLSFNKDSCDHKVSQPVCQTFKGNSRASDVTTEFLECEFSDFKTLTIILATGVSIFIGLATFIQYFRYELVIMVRNLRCRRDNRRIKPLQPFDVYISSHDPPDDLRHWISDCLVSHLELCGYKVCLPDRDFKMGSIRSEEIVEMLNISKNFVVMVSDQYLLEEDPWKEIEWALAYRRYRSHEIENIIIINYDHIRTSDVTDRRMKAFFRLGMHLDFSNHKLSLLTKVKRILGHKAWTFPSQFEAAKPKFDSSRLWVKFDKDEQTIRTNYGLNATKPKFNRRMKDYKT